MPQAALKPQAIMRKEASSLKLPSSQPSSHFHQWFRFDTLRLEGLTLLLLKKKNKIICI